MVSCSRSWSGPSSASLRRPARPARRPGAARHAAVRGRDRPAGAGVPAGVFPWELPDGVATVLWLGTYGLLIAIVVLNRHVTGFSIAGAGMLSNLIAITATAVTCRR